MVSLQRGYERLLRAVQYGSTQEVIALFSSGVYDINQDVEYIFEDRKKYTVTPLYWAVRYHRTRVCKYLLENGALPYAHMVYEYYPLHEACNKGYEDIVEEFINVKCNLNRTTNDLDTPLHIACMRGHIPCVHVLLRGGADKSRMNKDGHTPLQAALYHGHHDLAGLFKVHMEDDLQHHQQQQVTIAPCPNTVPTTGVVAVSSNCHSTEAKIQRSKSMSASSGSPVSSSLHPQRRTVHAVNRPTHVKKVRPISYHTEQSPSLPPYEPIKSYQTDSSFSYSNAAATTASAHTRPSSMQFSPLTHTSPSVMNQPRPIIHSNLSHPTTDSPSPVEKDCVTLVSSASTASVSITTACSLVQAETGSNAMMHPQEAACRSRLPHNLYQNRRSNLHKQSSEPVSQISRPGFRHTLYESASHPELVLSNLRKLDRRDDLIPAKLRSFPSKNTLISPSRERIDTLSKHFMSSVSPELKSSHPQWDPITKSIQNLIRNMAPLFNITEETLQALASLVSSLDISAENCSSSRNHLSMSCLSESIEYEHSDIPLAVRIDVPAKGYVTLVFEASLKQTSAQTALLKVVTRIFNLKDHEDNAQYHQMCLSPASSFASVVDSEDDMEYLCNPVLNELSILRRLSSCPTIAGLISHFQADTDRYSVFAKQFSPDDPSKLYTTASKGDFFLLDLSGITLDKYFEEKPLGNSLNIEEDILIVLVQVLLAVAFLNVNGIVHSAVLPENIFVESKEQLSIRLANLSHAIQLNPQTSDVIGTTEDSLAANIARSRCCSLPQEVIECVKSSRLENKLLYGHLADLFLKADSFAAGKMIYELLLGQTHEFLQENCTTNTPPLRMLSSKLNHLLKSLVAVEPDERLSAIDGVLCCMVLLFGPTSAELSQAEDSQRWILSEAIEFYMRPVLRDCGDMSPEYADIKSKLLCMYLVIGDTDPDRIFKASKFFE